MRVRDWGIALAASLYRRTTTPLVLQMLRQRPRHVPGVVRLPIGLVHYVDSLSCAAQYAEIFGGHWYEFDSDNPSPLVIDCGANIGLSIAGFKRQYPQARVVAFEADPAICLTLRENLDSLGIHGVDLVEAAVWTSSGLVGFQRRGDDSGHVAEGADAEPVRAVRLADYITETVDLLKMDIEGGEWTVVNDLLANGAMAHVRRMICEIHNSSRSSDGLRDMLAGLGRCGLRTALCEAHSAPYLPGAPESTPFRSVPDGKWWGFVYAWRQE